ncbi:MAG: TonB-dependent receptor [Bacteroidota bacterium]
MMNRIYVLTVFFLLSISANSQVLVKGRLVDSLTKVTLPGASVTVSSQSGKVLATTSTSKDGLFKVSLPEGSFQLSASYTGYIPAVQTIKIAGEDIDLKTISMLLDIKGLKTVKVVATKPFITMGPGKLTMNIAESGLSAGNTAWEMLQQAPGVQAEDEGSLSLNGKSVTVYIDGRRQYLSGEQLRIMLSGMQAKQIEKMELISNPSARYDAAGAAVINIKTIRLNKPGYNGTFISGIGSSRYLKYNAGVDMNYKSGKVNLYGGYDYSHNANRYLPLYERVTGTNKLIYINENETDYRSRNNNSYRAGMDWNINKRTSFGLLVRGFTNYRYRSVTAESKMGSSKSVVDSVTSTRTTGDATFSSPSVNLFYKTALDTSGEKELVLNADYYNYEQQWSDDFFTGFTSNGTSYQPNQYRRDNSPTILNIYSFSADYTQPLWKGKLEAGFKTSFVRTDNDVRWEVGDGSNWAKDPLRTNYFKYNEDINAVYAGYSKTFGKWETEAALRTEITHVKGHSVTIDSTFKRDYQDWFPSLGITYKPGKSNQWTLSYRKSIDRPAYGFVNPFVVFRGQLNYFRGNTNLRPMYSNSWELGYGYKSMLFVNFGYTKTNDFMLSLYQQDNVTKVISEYYDNVTTRHHYRLTVSFNKPVKKWWNTSNFISTSLTEFESDELASSTASTINCYLNTSQSFTITKWSSRVDISYFYNLPYSTGVYKYKGFGQLNLAFSKDIMKKKGSLRLNTTDLLKTYVTQKTTLYNGLQNTTTLALDSRTINLAFTYRFGKTQIRRANRRSSIESETGRIQ